MHQNHFTCNINDFACWYAECPPWNVRTHYGIFYIFFFNPSLNTFQIQFVTYKTCNMLNKLLCFVFWRRPLDKISSRHSSKIECKQIFFLCKRNCVAFDQKSICTELREASKCACLYLTLCSFYERKNGLKQKKRQIFKKKDDSK